MRINLSNDQLELENWLNTTSSNVRRSGTLWVISQKDPPRYMVFPRIELETGIERVEPGEREVLKNFSLIHAEVQTDEMEKKRKTMQPKDIEQ